MSGRHMLLGRVLGSSYDDDGFLGLQIEVFGSGTSSVGWFELSNPHGFQSRPLDPDANGGACQAYYWYEGSRGYAMLANDPRSQGQVPQLQKGEAFMHHPRGAGFVRMKADGGIALFTTDDGTAAGRSVFLGIDKAGLHFVFPYGKLVFDSTGFHVLHNSGARIDLGAVGGLPAPLDSLSSYVSMGAAIARIEGAAVSLGLRAGAAQPVALATTTLTVLTDISAALQAVGLALSGITAIPTNSAAAPASAAAVALVDTAVAAIGSAAATLPSVSTVST